MLALIVRSSTLSSILIKEISNGICHSVFSNHFHWRLYYSGIVMTHPFITAARERLSNIKTESCKYCEVTYEGKNKLGTDMYGADHPFKLEMRHYKMPAFEAGAELFRTDLTTALNVIEIYERAMEKIYKMGARHIENPKSVHEIGDPVEYGEVCGKVACAEVAKTAQAEVSKVFEGEK